MTITRLHEREVTFEVDPHWPLPALDAALPPGGRLATATHQLEAVYYDTAPPLLRPLGITLRRRRGGPDAGWHLKVPAGNGRTEVHSGATGAAVPAALARRLSGITAGRPLGPVATIATTRHTVGLEDASGGLLVEVADDHVSGTPTRLDGQPVAPVAWREVEVEVGPAGAESDLGAVAELLEAAGARVSGQQRKINRVLGEPPEPQVGGAAGAVAAYLREQCRAVLVGDARLRDVADAEPLHRTRVAVRRLRSTLRAFPHLLAPSASEPAAPAEPAEPVALDVLDRELGWLGSLLSPVRDADVLRPRLERELARLDAADVVGPVRAEVDAALATDREAGLAAWRAARDSERYRRLTATLGSWYLTSPVLEDVDVDARTVLRQAEKRVRRRRRRATDAHGMHQARKAAKRLRYTAEALAPEVHRAATVARRAKRQQSRWGEHQDIVVAAELLRRVAAPDARVPVRSGFTYGVLVARLDRRAEKLRRRR